MKFVIAALSALWATTAMAQTDTQSAVTISGWIQILALGAFAGAIGQLVRAVSGLAKITRQNNSGELTEQFRASTMIVSLLVGATAGALASLALLVNVSEPPPVSTILGLMAAGYAGSDFIEGFAGKHFGSSNDDALVALKKTREEITASAVEAAKAAVAAAGAQLTISSGALRAPAAAPASASGLSVTVSPGPTAAAAPAPAPAPTQPNTDVAVG